MKTTIDKAGRVVIPASIRARAGFSAGTELEVLVEDSGVRLVRVVAGPQLERVGKRLVARPRVESRKLPKVDVGKLIEDERGRWPW
jgi:AbrB family looped-hinge helix DNA binding protein